MSYCTTRLKLVPRLKSIVNPTIREQISHFWHLFVIQMTGKNLTFPKYLWQCLPYSFGVSKWPKTGFYSIFVVTGTKIWIWKYVFFGLFWAKMTKIGIQNPKLIVTNDYQKFWAHFDWFLSLFQISDVKPELLPVELKVSKYGIFWAKNLFQKFFS